MIAALGLSVVFLAIAVVVRSRRVRRLAQPVSVDPGPAPMSYVDPPPRRAAGPALRVHLCVACAAAPVRTAGDVCPTCLRSLNPVPRAEEITREAAR